MTQYTSVVANLPRLENKESTKVGRIAVQSWIDLLLHMFADTERGLFTADMRLPDWLAKLMARPFLWIVDEKKTSETVVAVIAEC